MLLTKKKSIGLAVAWIVSLLILGFTVNAIAQSANIIFTVGNGVFPGGAWTVASDDGASFYSKNPYGVEVYRGVSAAAAINSVIASDRWVQIKGGTWTLSASVSILACSDLRISGEGRVTTKLKAANSLNDNVITIRNSTHVTIEALTVDGNKANQVSGNGIDIGGTAGAYCSNIIIDKVQVLSCKQSGILIADLGGLFTGILFVTNSMIDFNGDSGVGAGIYLAAPDCIITGNDIGQNNIGIAVYAGACTISNNHVWGSTTVGVGLFSGSWHTGVTDNRIDFNLHEGVYINNSNVFVVTGNRIYLNGQAASGTYDGIYILGGSGFPVRGGSIHSNIIGTHFSGVEMQRSCIRVAGGNDVDDVFILGNNYLVWVTDSSNLSWDVATCNEWENLV